MKKQGVPAFSIAFFAILLSYKIIIVFIGAGFIKVIPAPFKVFSLFWLFCVVLSKKSYHFTSCHFAVNTFLNDLILIIRVKLSEDEGDISVFGMQIFSTHLEYSVDARLIIV